MNVRKMYALSMRQTTKFIFNWKMPEPSKGKFFLLESVVIFYYNHREVKVSYIIKLSLK
jgi:hypothetical protein